MLDKILSALPFNPSMVQQLSFYAKRVRSERSIRRVGLVFIMLAFLVQFFAFVSPPEPSLAASNNDLITGGLGSPSEAASNAASYCRQDIQDYQTILAYYGITCARVASANSLTIKSTDYPDQGGLWSMGRNPQTGFQNQSDVTIPGIAAPNNTFYIRPLTDWDQGGPPNFYPALNVTSTGGQTFFLIDGCGNLVSVGPPQIPKVPPNITIQKTTVPGSPAANSKVAPGTTLSYRIYFSNSGGPATNVQVTDPEPPNTTETWMSNGGSTATSYSFSNGAAVWQYGGLPSGASDYYVDVDYKVNAGVPNGTQICNTATIQSTQTSAISSNPPVCFTVQKITPPPPKTPPPKCEQLVSSENPNACVIIKKTASNLTANITNADGTTAHAGDLIKYDLYATNTDSGVIKNYVFEDNLSYVLDYSTMVNADGGKVNSAQEIIWPGLSLKAGQTITKSFEVRVDNPIPQTPTSTSDPNYYNLTMSNYFGNTITIYLPGSVVHAIQTASATLPNTGPGDSIIIAAVVVAVAGFFFYRSRLLAKEAKIAITEQQGGTL